MLIAHWVRRLRKKRVFGYPRFGLRQSESFPTLEEALPFEIRPLSNQSAGRDATCLLNQGKTGTCMEQGLQLGLGSVNG